MPTSMLAGELKDAFFVRMDDVWKRTHTVEQSFLSDTLRAVVCCVTATNFCGGVITVVGAEESQALPFLTL